MSLTRAEQDVGGMRVEKFFNRIWYGRSAWSVPLMPLSWLFSVGVSLRRAAYRWGIFRSESLPVPVVVVGNITVGGTGKTPVVAMLARELAQRGRRPGIVSRGYGGKSSSVPRFVTADSSVSEVGDEPMELHKRTGVPVSVCVNRLRAGQALIARGIDVIIADDGLQHYALARDLEIAVVDGSRLLGNGRMLPSGPLREPRSRLRDADIVLVNGEAEFQNALPFQLAPRGAASLAGDHRVDLDHFRGQRVWAVAGIANPARFVNMLAAAGIQPVATEVPDHGKIRLDLLYQKEALPILMTEKDAVKHTGTPRDDVWVVSVDIVMPAATRSALGGLIDGVLD